eukprot:GDKJ01013615.1.p1 GENE.GDKJ01013615.1~~GDKJ01013615.1.p1  ORF type:complete len:248 (+),score=14.11 GDKJ01013615.1:88-831(+)
MARLAIVILAVMAILIGAANATFTRIADHYPVCFSEDVSAASEIVVVEYSRPSHSNSDSINVKVKATSPYSKSIVFEGSIKPGQGSFTFKPISTESGEYEICLLVPAVDAQYLISTKSFVDVGIVIDHHSRRLSLKQPDPELTRTKVKGGSAVMQFTDRDGNQMETLRSVEFLDRINNLLENVRHSTKDIDDEVKYIASRGERMRLTSESLFSRIWTFSILTLVVMAAVGYMQYNFLTSFLKSKKLV